MRVSPNGKLVACFNESGVLTVMTTDFSKNLSQFNTESKIPPDQMEWCGVDSVLLYWDQLHLLLMIGPFSEYLKWTYDSSIYLAPELDGVRIISSDTCEFLSRVPSIYLSFLNSNVSGYGRNIQDWKYSTCSYVI